MSKSTETDRSQRGGDHAAALSVVGGRCLDDFVLGNSQWLRMLAAGVALSLLLAGGSVHTVLARTADRVLPVSKGLAEPPADNLSGAKPADPSVAVVAQQDGQQDKQQDGQQEEQQQDKQQDGQQKEEEGDQQKSQPPAAGEQDSADSSDDQADDQGDAEGSGETESASPQRRRRTSRFLQYTRFNEHIQNLLREQIRSVANSTVEVYVDDNEAPSALGMVVDPQGFVMTKASMLKGAVRCKLANGRMVPAIVYGVDTDTDLALLRLQVTNLPPIPWSSQPEEEAREGHWVLTPGIDGTLKSLGVVSVASRKIPSVSGFIGIQMQPHEVGVEVTQVIRGTAADRFGLKTSDVIVAVDEEAVSQPSDLSSMLRGKRPGDVVSLSVKRGSTTLALRVILGNREEDNPENERAINQNTMSGEISKRRDDFPFALQHDSVLTPEECGGPLVDLDGRVIGINISRAGRVNSYALPTSLVRAVFDRLATGQFSPEVVFAERLQGYETVLLSLNVEEVNLTTEKTVLEREAEEQAKAVGQAKESIKTLEEQIEALKRQIAEKQESVEAAETQESQIKSKIRSKERDIEKTKEQKQGLQREKKELLFGAN